MLRFSLIFCLALFLVLGGCKEDPKKVVETPEIAFKKEADLQLFKTGSDSLITRFDIEIADSEYETQTGLMYRESMEKNQGMLFIFPDLRVHTFYMKNTRFPLDLLFIDEQMKVASLSENAQPMDEQSISSEVPVKYVLEINAGLIREWGLSKGDSIAYQPL